MEQTEERKPLTWLDVLNFAVALTPEQLEQPVQVIGEEQNYFAHSVFALECDYVNPSGEMAEPISAYMPGGEFYDEEDPEQAERYLDEGVVAEKGDIFILLDI